jgi:serine/threonine protein kinase
MTPQSLEGQNIGKYRVLEALGRGGMAQVFKAYHPQLDRYVAIKVLRSDLVEETEFLERFRREAKAVSGLRHPNIVQVFDFDVQDEMYYMVMELLEGDTLRASLNNYRVNGKRMPIN